MNEICKNCGGLKEHHLDMDQFIGKEIDDKICSDIFKAALICKELYGNLCLNYKRDNLKYLESLVHE